MDARAKKNYMDSVSDGVNEAHTTASNLLDKIYMLAGEIVCRDFVGSGYADIVTRLNEINKELRKSGPIKLTFSGEGFVPVPSIDDDGDLATTYAEINFQSGVLRSLEVHDAADQNFLTREDVIKSLEEEEDDDDDEEGGLALLFPPETQNKLLANLKDPKTGSRLYAEFKLGERNEEGQLIGGLALRSSNVQSWNVVDVETMRIEDISVENDTPPEVEMDDIPEYLHQASGDILQLLKSTNFRRLKTNSQIKQLEAAVEHVNNALQLQKYICDISTDQLITVHLGIENRMIMGHYANFDYPTRIKPLRVECLERYNLDSGKRIVRDRRMYLPNVGIYLVGEIVTQYAFDGIPEKEIVWIPIEKIGNDEEPMFMQFLSKI